MIDRRSFIHNLSSLKKIKFTNMIFHVFIYILYHLQVYSISESDQLPVGFIAQLVERCTSVVQVMGLNPVKEIFFFSISQLLKLYVAAMINHFLIFFSAVHRYDLHCIHLYIFLVIIQKLVFELLGILKSSFKLH